MTTVPEFDFNITCVPVQAQPKFLKSNWSQGAVQDFMSAFGLSLWPRLPDNALNLLNDALEDPSYDPNSPDTYKGLWRWDDGRVATPEEVAKAHPESSLVERMADEMKAEIDKEIMRDLTSAPEVQTQTLVGLLNVVECSPVDRQFKDAARKILIDNLA